MTFQDKSIQCSDCGATFTFTAGEQDFYQTKGFTNTPGRCPTCRAARKSSRNGSSSYSSNGGYGNSSYSTAPRQMYPVKCAECGKDTEVPFSPRGDKPVYCSDCYRKVQVSR